MVAIRRLSKGEIDAFRELRGVFEEVFEEEVFDQVSDAYLQSVVERSDLIVLVATVGDMVVGGLTAFLLPQYTSQSQVLYLYDLGVRKSYQRQGLGRRLVAELMGQARLLGAVEVFVQADQSDQDALEFYRSSSLKQELEVVQIYGVLGQ